MQVSKKSAFFLHLPIVNNKISITFVGVRMLNFKLEDYVLSFEKRHRFCTASAECV